MPAQQRRPMTTKTKFKIILKKKEDGKDTYQWERYLSMYMISEERTRKRNIGLERGEGLCEFTKVKKVELIP